MHKIPVILTAALFLAGCAGMSADDKRMLFLGGLAVATSAAVIIATDGNKGPGQPTDGNVGSGLGDAFP